MDKILFDIVQAYGALTYAILFIVIFLETGFVVTPFLPGDSLIFTAGVIAASKSLDILIVYLIMLAAAFLGDTVNYWLGCYIGPRIFKRDSKFIKKEYLFRAEHFYERHGAAAIFLSRFVPIIRTFAPFVAGIGKMNYGYFLIYNLAGALTWVSLFLFSGYFFGHLPFVKANFHYLVVVIIVISVLPLIYERLRSKVPQ